MLHRLKIVALAGLTDYEEVWQMQKDLQRALIDGTGEQQVIICEHKPVITIGRGGRSAHLLASQEELDKAQIKVLEVERGGDITYHGPGQLVIYPIIDLNNFRRDVGWYIRELEQIAINILAEYKICGIRIPGKSGVWINSNKKIASVGVRISRWCTMHGLSINIRKESLRGFRFITACGLIGAKTTCLESELEAC